MIHYLAKRLALAFFTLFAILLVSYFLLRLAPGDPARSNPFSSDDSAGTVNTETGRPSRSQSLREQLYLDRPILVGFGYWLKGVALKGDFGASAAVDPGRPVTRVILDRLPVTLTLNLWAIVVTYLLAIPLGVYGAVHAGGWFDRISATFLFTLYSLPVMWVGLLLQAMLCEGGALPIFPLKGLTPGNTANLSTWQIQWELIRHYALPIFCLAYGGLAGISRYARGSMLEVLHSDYIRTARAKGLPEHMVVWKHAFRNGLITLITLFGGILPSLIAGSILVECIFSIPGMGSLALLSLSSRDYPLQMALFAFSGALTLAGILIADLCYLAADPRIRLS